LKEALKGLKVIDLCRSYPPGLAAMFLADFGADVIKIDTPGFLPPVPFEEDPERFAAHYALDRNKRSLSIKLKSNEGLAIFFKLAKGADIIIENSTPGTMEELGIDYGTIKTMNPKIVYCSVSGYGQTGPYRSLPGHDSNYLSISGALGLIGEKGGPPITPSNLVADMSGGAMHSLAAILIALLSREKSGKGQYIDISYTDAVLSLLTFEASIYFLTRIVPKRGETWRTGSEPFYSSYKTKDGKYINVACIERRLWEDLCRALGCGQFIPFEWAKDDKKREEIFSFFIKTFLTKTRDEWWEWAKDKRIALTPVLDLNEALNDSQLRHREMILELEHVNHGRIKQTGFPLKLSESPAAFRRFSPRPGEHTLEILKELGYDDQQIGHFKTAGVI
jgi:crotonobetainyl-CoA:carnitine CoA-transferase CaiB-like acyl-CoA transferase